MKYLHLVLALVLWKSNAPAQATMEAAKEFDQLLIDRDRRLASVTEPINQSYQLELEALLRKATLGNDLDTAARIGLALERLSQARKNDVGSKIPLVGAWAFANQADGHTAAVELHADKSYTAGGKQIGTWELQGKEIVVTYAHDGSQDRYRLPVTDEKLAGTNRLGHSLTLTRLVRFLKDEAVQTSDPLNLAVTSSNWSWENTDGGRKSFEDIQFYRGGFAQNPKFFTARWEAIGPRTVVLHNTNQGSRRAGTKAYIVFDAEFTHFIGFDFNGKTLVEGFRREWLDPARPAPTAK